MSAAADTVEAWARDYIASTSLAEKRAMPAALRFAPRDALELAAEPAPTSPGRPADLHVAKRAPKAKGPEAIRAPQVRAALLHTFLHHELQAAELMAWALLAFPDAPEAFRRGLLGIARDEIRHMGMYEAALADLGFAFGSFPVRDWFWERVPSAQTPLQFVATFGMGLEGANLDHTTRFAQRFQAIGDTRGAELQETIGAEEVPHVRFALHWFRVWAGEETLARWSAELPPAALSAPDARLADGPHATRGGGLRACVRRRARAMDTGAGVTPS